MIRTIRDSFFSVLLIWVGSGVIAPHSQANTRNSEALYSLVQAAEGHSVYLAQCANCHGVTLMGNEAGPALIGATFRVRWMDRPLRDLFDLTMRSMPVSNPGGLPAQEYEAVLAYMLYSNGYEAGMTPLALGSQERHQSVLGRPGEHNLPSLPVLDKAGATVEWLHHRGTPFGTNYSSLDLIHQDNVSEHEVAWRWKSDNFGASPWPNYQVTPLMANGVLYASAGSNRSVVALDAETGETLWMYRLNEESAGGLRRAKGRAGGSRFIAVLITTPSLRFHRAIS